MTRLGDRADNDDPFDFKNAGRGGETDKNDWHFVDRRRKWMKVVTVEWMMSEKSTLYVCEVKTCIDNYQACLDMGANELKWHVLWWFFLIKRLEAIQLRLYYYLYICICIGILLLTIAIDWLEASTVLSTRTITEKQGHNVVLSCRFEQLTNKDRVMW